MAGNLSIGRCYQPLVCRIFSISLTLFGCRTSIRLSLASLILSISSEILTGFCRKVFGAEFHRLDAGLDRALAGEHDDLGIRLFGLDPLQGLQTVDARHRQIEDDEIEALLIRRWPPHPRRWWRY